MSSCHDVMTPTAPLPTPVPDLAPDLAPGLVLRAAVAEDVPLILAFIRELAAYEKLLHECVADEASLRETLFGPHPAAEVLLAVLDGTPVGFALYFTTYSTFLARPGLYLEDIFVRPAARKRGVGSALMIALARTAVARGYGRFEWSVLDWNEPALRFYRALGAVAMDGWTVHRVTGDALAALAAR
ncbi:GNAT family N-acetyltransferase [Chondromyces apiculatus]|uniref:Acetyltransferase, GNAT family n=1 Tax=Chondromyces apiculatus DSM 436 TaxID=1192034 RepID=A0A017T0H0_9BACT|nr:GNAT family N-acetyltransferase [Chondromyces apiculatus]EYF02749.1 acetyltransferase, GNAT family [Chondromyces apiculatus DSM 436]